MGMQRPDRFLAEVLGEESAITPSELVSRTIKRQAVGGYDTEVVDDLLEHAAEALERLMTRLRELKAANEEQRAQLEEYRGVEASLRNALVSSQKFGEDIVEQAKREAALILAEARLQRDEVQAEAARLPETVAREVHLLIEERDRIRDDIIAVLDAHRHWVNERVPERDSALSERLLAFVNGRQGVALNEAHSATQPPPAEDAAPDEAGEAVAGEPAIESNDADVYVDDEDALPDVVLGVDMEDQPDFEGDVLEAVAEEDDPDEVKEPSL
jgi:cell division initiation protein